MVEFPDDEILSFALRFAPYGGPAPSDVFLQFGSTVRQFKRNLAAAVDRAGSAVPPGQRSAVQEYLQRPASFDETRWGQ